MSTVAQEPRIIPPSGEMKTSSTNNVAAPKASQPSGFPSVKPAYILKVRFHESLKAERSLKRKIWL